MKQQGRLQYFMFKKLLIITAHCYGHLAEAKVLQILITFAYNVSFIGVNQKATVHSLSPVNFCIDQPFSASVNPSAHSIMIRFDNLKA